MNPAGVVEKEYELVRGQRGMVVQRGSIRFHVARRPPRVLVNEVDAALADPLDPAGVSPAILDLGPVAGVAEARVGLPVLKSGRTSGVTAGVILATGVSALVSYAGRGIARFRGQVVTTFMAAPGDSGSLLVDGANRAVGLLFAGSASATLYNPILPVMRAFGVRFSPASFAGGEAPDGTDWASADAGGDPDGTDGIPAAGMMGTVPERRLREAVGRFDEGILRLRNVVGLGAGWKRVRGQVTDRPALVVLVRRKLPVRLLSAADRVPREVGGWPTDVVETGGFTAFQRTGRMRPAHPGVSISHVFGPTGTLGAVVFDKRDRPAILSNNHIMANATNGRDDRAALGDSILQPGGADGGTAPGDAIARLSAFVPLFLR